jgi:hypothetical protein
MWRDINQIKVRYNLLLVVYSIFLRTQSRHDRMIVGFTTTYEISAYHH